MQAAQRPPALVPGEAGLDQARVEPGRLELALAKHPRLLLCDEPSLGLAPLITREVFGILKGLNEEEGLAVLLVEQNANIAMDIADRAYLLETGRIVTSASPMRR